MLLAAKPTAASDEQCYATLGVACVHANTTTSTSGTSLIQVKSQRGSTSNSPSEDNARFPLPASCKADSLQFLHIPKNAGKTIQNIGLKHGLRWGTHAFAAIYHQAYHMLKMPDGNRCPALHVPPDMVPDPNPYKGREVFCVSRNPYSRAVSEYLWARERFDRRLSGRGEICPGCRRFSMCSVEGMNFFLKKVT